MRDIMARKKKVVAETEVQAASNPVGPAAESTEEVAIVGLANLNETTNTIEELPPVDAYPQPLEFPPFNERRGIDWSTILPIVGTVIVLILIFSIF
jgi:hypothetical protein